MNKHIQVGIGVMILHKHHILMGHRRQNAVDTGGIYEPDSWCLPGGKQEYHETILEAAKREVKEETNLDIEELEVFHVVDDFQKDRHFVTIQIIAHKYSGELQVKEPDKQDQWQWFDLDWLPQHIYSPSQKFIQLYLQKQEKK